MNVRNVGKRSVTSKRVKIRAHWISTDEKFRKKSKITVCGFTLGGMEMKKTIIRYVARRDSPHSTDADSSCPGLSVNPLGVLGAAAARVLALFFGTDFVRLRFRKTANRFRNQKLFLEFFAGCRGECGIANPGRNSFSECNRGWSQAGWENRRIRLYEFAKTATLRNKTGEGAHRLVCSLLLTNGAEGYSLFAAASSTGSSYIPRVSAASIGTPMLGVSFFCTRRARLLLAFFFTILLFLTFLKRRCSTHQP